MRPPSRLAREQEILTRSSGRLPSLPLRGRAGPLSFQERGVADAEKQGFVAAEVSVAVRAPVGNHEAVASGPAERFIARGGFAYALNHEVDRAGGVAVVMFRVTS